MPRRVPSYRLHKPSGRAVVTLDGEDFYLGKYGSPESRSKYARLIADWTAGALRKKSDDQVTIVNLLAAYRRHAQVYYNRSGNRPTGELANIDQAIRPLKQVYGEIAVEEFGPRRLEAIRRLMLEGGGYRNKNGQPAKPLSRSSINARIGILKRIFKWGVSQELVPAEVYLAISTLAGLQSGRSEARETDPVAPADDRDVEAALPFMPAIVADLVRLQRLTGCRPGEIRILRPADVDRSSQPWVYRPQWHKTEHRGHKRLIFLGPQAQKILLPYLLRDAESYCFSPADAERKRKEALREARKTKVQPSQLDRSKPDPKRTAGKCYTKDSYNRAIARACDLADAAAHQETPEIPADERIVKQWTPNQLRHAAATRIRKEYGLEAAQVILGHSRADVTQLYAERDLERAANVMKEIG